MTDVTVLGAGIFGLSAAWEMIRRGARVRVIDPGGPGAGASGGIVGALQPHVPEPWNIKKEFQLESLLMARDFWRGVEAVSGISPGYACTGRLQPLSSEADVERARDRAGAAAERWRGATWEVIAGAEAGDWRPPSPTGLYVRDSLSALLHPRRGVQSLAAAIAARGGEIVADAPAEGLVLHATGWRGLRETGAGDGVKGQAALLAHDAAGACQVFADGLHIVPHLDGTTAIGSTSEREWSDPSVTDAQLDALIEKAGELMPVLHGARVLTRWAGVRPRAKSRAPLLGPLPGQPGHFVMNGGLKIGFGMAPKCAEVIVDLLLEGRDTIPPDFHTKTIA
jgi:glycine/D-amino acid oxidase-like deaminating enzyme